MSIRHEGGGWRWQPEQSTSHTVLRCRTPRHCSPDYKLGFPLNDCSTRFSSFCETHFTIFSSFVCLASLSPHLISILTGHLWLYISGDMKANSSDPRDHILLQHYSTRTMATRWILNEGGDSLSHTSASILARTGCKRLVMFNDLKVEKRAEETVQPVKALAANPYYMSLLLRTNRVRRKNLSKMSWLPSASWYNHAIHTHK